jgi:hypothetical protein
VSLRFALAVLAPCAGQFGTLVGLGLNTNAPRHNAHRHQAQHRQNVTAPPLSHLALQPHRTISRETRDPVATGLTEGKPVRVSRDQPDRGCEPNSEVSDVSASYRSRTGDLVAVVSSNQESSKLIGAGPVFGPVSISEADSSLTRFAHLHFHTRDPL